MEIGNSSFVPFKGPQFRDQFAFTGIPQRVSLRPGELLCRFITAESAKRGHGGNEIFLSPWWHSMGSFMQIYRFSKTDNMPLIEAARGKLAITSEFNPTLEYFCQITITHPIYGWKGIASYQADHGRNLCYLGGAQQIYVPNLVSPHSHGLSSDYAVLRYFGPTDVLG